MKKYDVNAPIVFKKGFHDLNDEPHINYQLNRMINWSGGDLEEVERVSRRIKDFDDWKRTLMELGARALAEERVANAIAYYRMAEFYMSEDDPDALACYDKAREYITSISRLNFKQKDLTILFVSVFFSFRPLFLDKKFNILPVSHAIHEISNNIITINIYSNSPKSGWNKQ